MNPNSRIRRRLLPIPGSPPLPTAATLESGRGGGGSRDGQSLESPLGYDFPGAALVTFGFLGIDVPAGLSIPTGRAAWYGLSRTAIPGDVGQECYWTGYSATMMPGDTGAAGDARLTGTAAAWGDTAGAPTVYLVIGPNLPIQPDAWTDGPADLPGLAATGGASGPTQIITEHRPRSRVVIPYPIGNYATAIGRQVLIENKTPLCVRLAQGSTLDVAFVIKRDVVASLGAARVLAGYTLGQLTIGQRFSDQAFTGVG